MRLRCSFLGALPAGYLAVDFVRPPDLGSGQIRCKVPAAGIYGASPADAVTALRALAAQIEVEMVAEAAWQAETEERQRLAAEAEAARLAGEQP